MSLGKPIITTDAVGAAFDLVKNGVNGFIVKNGDVLDLYIALKRIITEEKRIDVMGQNSRKLFEQFNSFDKMFDGFKKAISYAIMKT
jgi:glycosyltransferase involved in cell wall biosynthesis